MIKIALQLNSLQLDLYVILSYRQHPEYWGTPNLDEKKIMAKSKL